MFKVSSTSPLENSWACPPGSWSLLTSPDYCLPLSSASWTQVTKLVSVCLSSLLKPWVLLGHLNIHAFPVIPERGSILIHP